jgi:hypothetical protein
MNTPTEVEKLAYEYSLVELPQPTLSKLKFDFDNGLYSDPVRLKHFLAGFQKAQAIDAARIAELEKSDEEWNHNMHKWQAIAQERKVGPHYCPDWDEMFLAEGAQEFCACTCKYDQVKELTRRLAVALERIKELEAK